MVTAYERDFGLLQYRAVHSAEQQQVYERDFKADYAEYSIHHAESGLQATSPQSRQWR